MRTSKTYRDLKELYKSGQSKEVILKEKAKIIDQLVADLKLKNRPNNATLGEGQVYNGGAVPLHDAHVACGDLRTFVEAAKKVTRRDFAKDLQEDLESIKTAIIGHCRK